MITEPLPLLISLGFLSLTIYLYTGFKKRGFTSIKWPHIMQGKPLKQKGRQYKLWLPFLCYSLSLALFTGVLLRPQSEQRRKPSPTPPSISLLLLDRSGSMKETVYYMNTHTTRWNAARKALQQYLEHAGQGDVGLITFAAFAHLNSPLSSDITHLKQVIDTVEVAGPAEQGTAIGDALHYAIIIVQQHYLHLEELLPANLHDEITKNIILLTDGEQNLGQYEPLEAAFFAEEHDVAIFPIIFKEQIDSVSIFPPRERTDQKYFLQLQEAAEITNGEFYHAQTGEELEHIYSTISREQDESGETPYRNHKEFYLYFLLPALFFLGLGETLKHTWAKNPL